jgi:threonine dehydrogenase-like Zn-dependent dehydrogenase
MKVALIYGPMDVRVVDVPRPEIGAGEVLIRVKICMTSGTTIKQYIRPYPGWGYPHGFGYEWVGEIEDVGEGVDKSLIGKRCTTSRPPRACSCFFCVRGKPHLCSRLRDARRTAKHTDNPEKGEVSGRFVEYVKAPASLVNILPDHLSSEDACQIPYVAVAQHGNNNVDIKVGDTVATVGAGAMGMIHLMLSRIRGAQTVAIDKTQARLDFAKKIGVADYVINAANTEEAQKGLKELNVNDGYGPDVVIESVGLPETYEEAFALVRRGGQVLMYGGALLGTTVTFDTYHLHYDEITIVASTAAAPIDRVRAYNLVERGRIKPSVFISGEYPLTEIKEALELHRTGKGIKYAIIP